MPPGIEEVRHDIAALHRFVDSIASDCARIDEYPSYARASKDFFNYINQVAAATKIHLENFLSGLDPALPSSDPQEFYSRTQVIRTLRTIWFELHKFVQPALDADTLHVPYALVNALTARLRKIQGFEDVEFAVLHTTDFNYFQVGASSVRDLAANIAAIVPGAPPFPGNLGIIALPYSQSTSIFLNIALAHEMGHFAFQERDEASRLTPEIVKAVLKAASGIKLVPLDLVWCKDRVLDWCEEIFCDLFALWLIGPSFAFSFIELFAYARLAPVATSPTTTAPAIASVAKFGDSHPAPAFRIGEHVRFLKDADLGWWNTISGGSSHYLRLMAEAESLPSSSFQFVSRYRPGLADVSLAAFFEVTPEITKVVKDAFEGVATEVKSFDSQRELIEEYLSFGVVPSRLVDGTEIVIPTVVALVNASNLFYLEKLDVLIKRIKGGNTDCLECRSLWAERLEMWTTKALEDVSR